MITMFSASASPQDLNRSVFTIAETDDTEPWRGVFVNSLRKVLDQVHPTLTAREDALDYVEKLIIQLLTMLCQKPSPHNIADVEERVRMTFPNPIDKWALDDAREALEKYKRRSDQPVLPVEKIHQMLQKEVLQYKLDLQVIVFIAAVLEYISADLFKLTGNYVKNIHHVEITCQDIRVAMCADKVLADMFTHNGSESVAESDINLETSSYENAVKDFIHDEKQHLHNLNMISKVFLEKINNVLPITEIEALQNMFQNLSDLTDLTFTIIASFEDIVEMNEDRQPLLVGSFLEDLAEVEKFNMFQQPGSYSLGDEEFEVYSRFGSDIIQMKIPDLIVELLSENNRLDVLASAGHGFREAVKYYLPKLLYYPIWHCFAYFDYVKMFQEVSESETDKSDLEQLEGLLKPLQSKMTNLVSKLPKSEKEYGSRLNGKVSHTALIEKVEELKKTVDGFASKYSKQYYTEFLRDDTLSVKSGNKRIAERRATLFDGVLVLSKRKRSVQTSGPAGASGAPVEYKLKDQIHTRKVEIKDREDTEEIKNAFEIVPREQPPFVCVVKSPEEKSLWMSDLIMLNIKCMLDRSLNSVLDDIERKNPLKMPSVEIYRFAEPDSPENIIFEGSTIKGGTLLKLVERLTYHVYADGMFTRTFLMTYRTFITGQGLLDLLIERYHVPDAQVVFNVQNTNSVSAEVKEDMKRYRKNYYQPIQVRVLNVLKKWVDCYFYDLENDVELINKINEFLDSIPEKSMKKWVVCIKTILQRKKDPVELSKEMIYNYEGNPPPIEWHIIDPEKDSEAAWKEWNCYSDNDDPYCVGWKLLTLHPVEIARQLTLIEYNMYKAVRSSELIGAAWTKDNKEEMAPNVTKIMRSTTNFTLWLEKTIVETENLEERVAIMTRLLEIMIVLLDLNNFNGVFSIFSALQSACVYRLSFTIAKCPKALEKMWREVEVLYGKHYKKYIERLHNITPPCVPFFGVFLTKLMHAEEGNPDFLNDKEGLINFSKRKFVTDIIQEIQRFQDKPYRPNVEPKIKEFLETLFFHYPFDIPESEALNDLYKKSLKIEPKEPKEPREPKNYTRKPLAAPRKWPDLNLKSPGIKLRNSSQSFRLGLTSNQKVLATSEDVLSGFTFSPVASYIYSGPGKRNRFNLSTSSLVPISSSGPVSPSREISVFSPIFFGTDLPPGAAENTHTSPVFTTEEVGDGPPLPPRVSISCPIIPPRDTSPPPLPPRRDSLHVRQNSVDSSRFMMSFDSMAPFGTIHLTNTLSPPSSSDSISTEKHRFDFPPHYHFNSCTNDLDLEHEMSPDIFPLLISKPTDLMEFDDPVSSQNCVAEEASVEPKSPSSVSLTHVFPAAGSAAVTSSDWNGFPKFSIATDKCNRPLPSTIIIQRNVPTMFQFNLDIYDSVADSPSS